MINIHISAHVYLETDKKVEEKINLIHTLLQTIIKNQNQMTNELETLTTEVEETKTVVDSAIVLIKGLKEKLDAAGTDPAKLKALSDSLDTKTNELAEAVAANTPASEEEGNGGGQ